MECEGNGEREKEGERGGKGNGDREKRKRERERERDEARRTMYTGTQARTVRDTPDAPTTTGTLYHRIAWLAADIRTRNGNDTQWEQHATGMGTVNGERWEGTKESGRIDEWTNERDDDDDVRREAR